MKGTAMSQGNDGFNPFDPTGILKSMRDTSMDAWSKMMIQVVNSDAYAQATATLLDTWLSTSLPFRKALETAMIHALAAANIPSRADVISLAERLTNIEMRLDDLDAKVDEVLHSRRPAAARPKPRSGPAEERHDAK
jgi:hypothetical protein